LSKYQERPKKKKIDTEGVEMKCGKKENRSLFDKIAPVYGHFYNMQKKRYAAVVEKVSKEIEMASYDTVIDVGCGTGALCSVLREKGLSVTGVDPAEKMLDIARKTTQGENIRFVKGSTVGRLPFENDSFDVAIASYVAHGMEKSARKKLYAEMSRLAAKKVIIYDYNKKRAFFTSLVEWMEGGDYFHFIKDPEDEMKKCISQMNECFSEVKVIDVDTRAAWYICTPY
jgi:ubiquinone/menaquinone biosynthesis C-methylase UbiE